MLNLRRFLWIPLGLPLLILGLLQISPSADATADSLEQTVRQLTVAVQTYQNQIQQKAEYDTIFRRDPMQPLMTAQGGMTSASGLRDGLAVQGVFWSETHPLVVIDNQMFSTGDEVGAYKILEIRKDRVVAQKGDHPEEILLYRELEEKEALAESPK